MARYRHLKNAPITEAIIDLRIKPILDDSILPEILSIKDDIISRYPNHKTRQSFEGGFGFKDGKPIVNAPKNLGVIGHIFNSADNLQVVQFRKDGFTFSRLQPYTNWTEVLSEARDLWGIYTKKTSPEFISRIAVRYINRLQIPLPIQDFSYYLTEPPNIPENAPNFISSFFYKTVLHDPEHNIAASVVKALESSIDPKFTAIILDNDVYQIQDYESTSQEIWEVFDKLHELKNNIFFGSITENTARLFE